MPRSSLSHPVHRPQPPTQRSPRSLPTRRRPWLLLSSLTAAFALTAADTTFDAPGNSNPLVPGYFADPTLRQFGDTFYLYATTDGNGGGRGPATVWVSKDFVHWVLVPMNWPTTPFYWAPDVLRHSDGRYYLFYNQPCNTFGGVSDSPLGPWTPLTPGDGLVIPDRLVKDVITLDTQFFVDTDGTLYGHWGTWGIFANSGCGFGVFNPDLTSFARLGMIPNTQARDFFEAPFMIRRNGVYYFTYSSGSCHDASYRVQYAVSNQPDGPFTMGPNNPILATSADEKVHGPGHHSILQRGDDYFIVYHRHDLPFTPNGMHRQTCADRLFFEREGVIRKVEPTHQGLGPLAPPTRPANLAFTRPVTASSHYRDTLRHHEYQPAYAVDDNNATLWRPADNLPGQWLTVDLGAPQTLRCVETQFEYATWFYQYLLEVSLDGQTWQVFADRRNNTRWGSPMVDQGQREARYLRLTVTGTEFPGLFGAVWNLKAYSAPPTDPHLALADRAFGDFIAPRIRSGAPNPAPNLPNATASASPPASSAPPTPRTANAPVLPLIHLDVTGLPLGTALTAWTNHGTLHGQFRSDQAPPVVDLAAGRKALRFSGQQILTASFPAPRTLAGNSSFTVAAWVLNPEIAESECLISWAGRGGPDATTAQFGYGSQRDWGAVGHWGFADLGFRGPPPPAGQWHHLAVRFDGVIERLYVNGQLNHSEAKMLLMHQGRPIHVGASEPGTEPFDGYLASLRLYDQALDESAIKALAADAPGADVLVHIDSARLDDGPLPAWTNSGSLGQAFTSPQPPTAQEVHGRIAALFDAHQSLELSPTSPISLGDFTLVASLLNLATDPNEAVLVITDTNHRSHPLLVPPAADRWQYVALVYQGESGTQFLDGTPTPLALPAPPKSLRNLHLGAPARFSGALTRLQLFRRALSADEIAQLHRLWSREWQLPTPTPPAFALPPTPLAPTLIAMAAQPGTSTLGTVEYRFTETTGHPGSSNRAWSPAPFFIDDNLQPNTRYAYTLALRDPLGNLSSAPAAVATTTDATLFRMLSDPFSQTLDYLVQGTQGTPWDGTLMPQDGAEPEFVRVHNGTLQLQSKGTVWDGGKPLGPFLYKLVQGDFVTQVRVVDYSGLATRRVPGNNDGGLMARIPRVADAGPGEDLVQLNFFPIWNQGNMVTSLDGGRSQKGNLLAWDAHRHLQIIRHGPRFHFRTSPDGNTWTEMPGSPVERPDMATLPLQVGLYHASYGAERSQITFDDFQLITR